MNQQGDGSGLRHLDFMLIDLFSIEIAFLLSCYIRIGLKNISDFYFQLAFMIALLDIGIVYFSESYKNILRRGLLKELQAACSHVVIVVGLVIIYLFITKTSQQYSRQVIISTFLFGIVFVYIDRILFKYYLHKKFEKLRYMRSVMVVTTRFQAEKMLNRLTPDIIRDYKITELAIIDAHMTGETIGKVVVSACMEDLLQRACSNVIDEVFIDIPGDSVKEAEIAKEFLRMGITIHISMDEYYSAFPNRKIENINDLIVLSSSIYVASTRQLFVKRMMDLAGAIVGLCMTVMIGLFLAPAIYICSPGPVLFSQVRVGKNGRKFKLYKFRSMYPDAENRKRELVKHNKMSGFMFKMDDDPRIIKGIGTFIRKTSLDEFPQFYNVLMGDMGLVGTRPPTVDEYEKYELHHKKRLSIKPGITGLWQVSGRSEITDFEAVVQLDNEYIENWSLSLDMKILFKTVKIVLFGKGAL